MANKDAHQKEVEYKDIPVPQLRDETRRSIRGILTFSFFIFSIHFLGLKIPQIGYSGATIIIDKPELLPALLFICLAYNFIIFLFRFYIDLCDWHITHLTGLKFGLVKFDTKLNPGTPLIKMEASIIYGIRSLIRKQLASFALVKLNKSDKKLLTEDAEWIMHVKQWTRHKNKMLLFWLTDLFSPVLFAVVVVLYSFN